MGDFLFSGGTARGVARRALLGFDLTTDVPAGAVITDATLTMTVNKVPGGAVENTFGLHRLTSNWNEGTTDASGNEGRGGSATGMDATWTTSGLASWTPGGEFIADPSSEVAVGGRGTYEWNATPAMLADLTQWLTEPATNFGWILIGDENTSRTAKRFISRDNSNASQRPSLTLQFDLPSPGLRGDFDGDMMLTVNDVDLLCGSIQSATNPTEFDLDGDEGVDGIDLAIWIEEFGTLPGDANLNGTVNVQDFLALSRSFQAADATYSTGDFDCNGEVNVRDFLTLSRNFGQTSGGTMTSTVPEPTTPLFLLIFGLTRVVRRGSTRGARHDHSIMA